MTLKSINAVFLASAIATISTITGCASYIPGSVPPASTKLTGQEINSLVSTLVSTNKRLNDGYDGGLTYWLRDGGNLEVKSRYVTSKTVFGKWRVDAQAGKICTQIERDPEACYTLHRVNQDTYYIDVPNLSSQANTLSVK
jgi:hypothetical protein